ncbi:hypothetical protein H8356DRAFT_968924 [Neocallimastix lanati (nom. inval.)]|uniref:Uncharacterized protein n=1 Tax=Neocallimastix californiae TaxID=1754190 RepID=A0A1Y2BQH2_9FUNG|nr:hypothetical protein H8356DRAFT_968924 [Neocallimastix sp. JGI-2020a]ORY36983.1 hypothetical protein LY90DRAFT_511412 [Neocallimastix californiae]|eukprot:ORY36983.1 hypothetical protein LY90DRAFT_511412 [Neocallimastix californiae]
MDLNSVNENSNDENKNNNNNNDNNDNDTGFNVSVLSLNKYIRRVIQKLKEELEEENYDNNSEKSIETIVIQKITKKEEKCFKDYNEASYICKFLMYNRSIESLLLIEKIFKECINEFSRTPYVYIDFWNHLFGIRLFVYKNKMFYDDYQSSLDRIQDLSEKLLFRVSNLEINLKIKFLIYYSSYYSGISKELFKKNRKGSANNTSNNADFGIETDIIKNIAITYHIKSINIMKNLFNELKNVNSIQDLNVALCMNDDLSDIVYKAENYYKVYISKFSFSNEAVQLYILFEMMEEMKEMNVKSQRRKYEKSEGASSTASANDSRHIKTLSNYENRKSYSGIVYGITGTYNAFQSPFIVSRIKYDIRLSSIALVGNRTDLTEDYFDDLEKHIDFLKKNSQSKFGPLYMKALDLVVSGNQVLIDDELRFVYIVLGICFAVELVVIFYENLDNVIDNFDNQINQC